MIDKNDIRNVEDERMLEDVIKLCVHAPKTAIEIEGADVVTELVTLINKMLPDPFSRFVEFFGAVVPVACYGLTTVSKQKKDSIKAMLLPILGESTAELLAYDDLFYEPLTDDKYNYLIYSILPLGGWEPFTSNPYSLDITSAYAYYVYRFILYCAIVGEKNEEGINKLRELRRDYVSYYLNFEYSKKVSKTDSFKTPTYLEGNNVEVDKLLSVTVPDGFEYITNNHIPQNDPKSSTLLDNYSLVAVSEGWSGCVCHYKDAKLGINISKAKPIGEDNPWDDPSKIFEFLEEKNIKTVRNEDHSVIGYGKGNECKDSREEYWAQYFIYILCEGINYTCNLYFNGNKRKEKEYIDIIVDFCNHIQLNPEKSNNLESEIARERLGSMIEKNGRISGILVSQLYSKDVIFHNEDEIKESGKRTVVKGFQLNSERINDFPVIVQNFDIFQKELFKLYEYVESNEKLRIPKSKTHKEIFKATKGHPITGIIFFELCAWHMITILDSENNHYTVIIDSNLIRGIPDAFSYVGEFIKTLRTFNNIYDDFEVEYVSSFIADGPCDTIFEPVKGAYLGKEISFKYSCDQLPNDEEKCKEVMKGKTDKTESQKLVAKDKIIEKSKDIELVKIQKQIQESYDNLEQRIIESNNGIMGSTPITRKNDARIKKLIANTEKIISDYASNIVEIMEKLDNEASNMDKNSRKIAYTAEIIIDCFEKLHVKFELKIMPGNNQVIKYEIGQKEKNISSRWKRKYKTLPAVCMDELEEKYKAEQSRLKKQEKTISETRKQLEELGLDVEKKTKNTNTQLKRLDTSAQKLKDEESGLLERKDEKNKKIEEYNLEKKNYESQIESYQNEEKKFTDRISPLKEAQTREVDVLRKQENEYKSQRNSLEFEIKQLQEQIRTDEIRESQFRNEEQTQRAKAEKSFLFKKKILQKAEELSSLAEQATRSIQNTKDTISEKESLIQKINTDYDAGKNTQEDKIRALSESINELSTEKDSYTYKKNKCITELSSLSQRISVLQDEIKVINNDLKPIQEKMKEIDKKRKGYNKDLKDIQKKYTDLAKELNQYEKERDAINDDLEKMDRELQNFRNIIVDIDKSADVSSKSVESEKKQNETEGNSVEGFHFYIKDELNQKLIFSGMEDIESEADIDLDVSFEKGDNFIVDIIEQPLQYHVSADEVGYSIEIFVRHDIGVFAERPNIVYSIEYNTNTPKVGGIGGIANPENTAIIFLKSASELRKVFISNADINSFKDIDNENEGILVSSKGDDLQFLKVKGKKRPSMMCQTLLGGIQMGRPYMDEAADAWMMSSMSEEDLIQEAEDGDVEAMKQLAISYMNGEGDYEMDAKKAASWMEKAAEEGDVEAQFNIALYYAKGFGVKRDFNKMVMWMEKARDNGEDDANSFLEDFGDIPKQIKMAEKNDTNAQVYLAEKYMKLGFIMDEIDNTADFKESIKWATRASEKNNAKGFWVLALAYEHGRGVKVDQKKAVELYEKGAKLKDPACQHSFGCHLLSGEGIKKDSHKGFAMVKKAAEQGYGLAMRELGRCYQFAIGTPGNMKTAVMWYEKALDVINDPELAQKLVAFRHLEKIDPSFGEDYPESTDD